ncbi:MAG: two-component sensor histidine kinase [Acidimicrobiia bacterium]|nr:two-component sensor histidine kinase [Acidimicrobiia bacterium]
MTDNRSGVRPWARGPNSTTRVVVAILGLITVAFAASGVIAVRTLRAELVQRVDDGIIADARSISRALSVLTPEQIAALGADSPTVTATTAFMILGPDGAVLASRASGAAGKADPVPKLPPLTKLRRSGGPFTVSAVQGNLQYRAVTATVGQDTVLVASPLADVSSTARTLGGLLLLIGLIVVLVLGLFIWAVVATNNRRVDHMIDTATQIGHGDLGARIDDLAVNSSAGRLGRALNEMLGQLEAAFADREVSDARLRRFAADASHELRTPLTHIRGYAELLRSGAATDPDDQRRAVTRIEAEAARMTVLVEDLLLLARLDQHQKLDTEPVNLAAVVTESVADARILEPQRPFTLEVPDEPVMVLGDDARLRQVLGVLLSNIRVHTDADTEAKVRLTVAGPTATVTVADHGRGMAPEVAAKVFDRFYRPEDSRSRASGGSGLGLSIAREVVHAHGGSLQLDTTLGQGSVFTITLATLAVEGAP